MIEDLARHWLAAMLGVSIQFTVLAAVVAAALFVSRPLAPRVRHAVWLLVLLRLTIPTGLTSPVGAVPASLVGPPSTGAPAADTVPANGPVETTAGVVDPVSASGTRSGEDSASTTRSAPAAPAVVLLLAWAGGVLVLASAHLVRAARRRVRTRGSTALPPRLEARIDELRRELGLHRTVDARMVPDDVVAGPVVQGFARPRVLLPARLVRSWRSEELDAVLLHELVHLRRRDPAVRALANLLQIVYFFHPLVWWVGRRLAAERERAWDSTAESEALVPYLETFRLEPILRGGAPAAGTVMVDLRVSPRGVEVATRRVDEEELERRLAEIYGLPEGRNLDLLPAPHPPEREVLYRTGHPVQARAIPWGADMLTIAWTAGRPTLREGCFGCGDLLAVIDGIGVLRASVRFEGGARNVPIDADIVMLEDASRDALLDDLPHVLRDRFDLGLEFRITVEPSPTLVLGGAVGDPPPDDEFGGRGVLHVFTDGRDERGWGGGGAIADAGALAELLSRHLMMPVVDETSGAVDEPFRGDAPRVGSRDAAAGPPDSEPGVADRSRYRRRGTPPRDPGRFPWTTVERRGRLPTALRAAGVPGPRAMVRESRQGPTTLSARRTGIPRGSPLVRDRRLPKQQVTTLPGGRMDP